MIPSKLRMKNFFSHKDSEIDFSMFNSALLIGNTEGDYSKSNGSGKSAIFEGILWCLFNKSRAAMMDDIIRWGEKTCSVELEFVHGGKRYLVTRVRNRINSTSTVEFYSQSSDGEWANISCSTSGDTNFKIEETIKLDYKTFINSVYFRQNDISEFAESDPSRKKEILKSIVDISRWDEYEKSAKKLSKDIKLECKILRGAISDFDEVAERLANTSEEIGKAEKSSKSYSSMKSSLQDEIQSLEGKYTAIKKSLDTDTYDKVVVDIKSLKDSLRSLKEKESELKASIDSGEAKKLEITEAIAKHKSLIEGKEEVAIEEGLLNSLREKRVECKSSISSAQQVLAEMADVEILSGECYTCKQPIDDDLHKKLLDTHNSRESNYRLKLSSSKELLIDVESRLELLVAAEKENSVILSAKQKIDSLEYKLNLFLESYERTSASYSELQDKISQVKFKIKNNLDILESIKNEDFQTIRVKLKALNESYQELSDKISDNDKELGRLCERQSVLAQRVEKMKLHKEEISKKLKRASLFEKLSKMFGKSGIQTILLDVVIEDLEKTSNGILASICNEPAAIVLETQRLGSDGVSVIETLDLKVRKDGHLQNFKSLSGGEKFRISLALRVALSDISSRYGGSSLEFLLLDEVNSPLDRFGVETLFVNVIKSLEDRYKILVITHDESLKEKFDNVINITKVNGDSELSFSKR
tara:strand:- start:91 stop:2196 length:2106 start_codon:yes stop_codon:yes gene_type:complete